jgi:hypothetical protein
MDKREWGKWIDGLVNTVLAGAILSGLDLVTSPAGEFHWKLIGASLLWNLKSYLKEHPIPSVVTVKETVTATPSAVTSTTTTTTETAPEK